MYINMYYFGRSQNSHFCAQNIKCKNTRQVILKKKLLSKLTLRIFSAVLTSTKHEYKLKIISNSTSSNLASSARCCVKKKTYLEKKTQYPMLTGSFIHDPESYYNY